MIQPNQALISRFCSRMVSLHRTSKIALMVTADLIALPFCFLIAMLLRGGDLKLASHFGPASYILVAVVTIAAFSVSDLYRAVIRFIDQRLLSVTGIALAVAILCAYAVTFSIKEENFPRSALAIYWFIVFSYVIGSRIGVRNFLRNQHAGPRGVTEVVAIYGAGEYGAFTEALDEYVAFDARGRTHDDVLADLRPADFTALGDAYQHRIAQLGGIERGHLRVVDKSLPNFAHLGLIHLALPNARFIHVRRSAVDTCLSCFSKWLPAMPFTFDLAELGRYYAEYERQIAHWRSVLPP